MFFPLRIIVIPLSARNVQKGQILFHTVYRIVKQHREKFSGHVIPRDSATMKITDITFKKGNSELAGRHSNCDFRIKWGKISNVVVCLDLHGSWDWNFDTGVLFANKRQINPVEKIFPWEIQQKRKMIQNQKDVCCFTFTKPFISFPSLAFHWKWQTHWQINKWQIKDDVVEHHKLSKWAKPDFRREQNLSKNYYFQKL